jgi:hypothetical protein
MANTTLLMMSFFIVIGGIIVVVGTVLHGYATEEFMPYMWIGGPLVLLGLIGVPIIAWQYRLARELEEARAS